MKKQIINDLYQTLKDYNFDKNMINLNSNSDYGDFSTNIAFQLSKMVKKSPMDIAMEVKNNLNSKYIKQVEVVLPGFINLFLKDQIFIDQVNKVIQAHHHFGQGQQNKYINVEYVSVNPTGYLHLGHARSAALGSALVNILRFAGNKVDAEYYINDAGNQINILGNSIFVQYQNLFGHNLKLPTDSYQGPDINDCAQFLKEKYGTKFINKPYQEVSSIFKKEGVQYMMSKIKEHLQLYRVQFDLFSSEKDIYNQKLISKTISDLKKYVYSQDGALWLKTSAKGDDKDRALRKSDNTYTYFMPDIAYHNQKITRGYNELINIWGADHIGYIVRMKTAIEYLGFDTNKLDILVVQMVKILKNGQELKMSKRKGTSYLLVDLINEISVDAARWFMLDKSNNAQIVFDLNQVVNTNDNPLYTIQYTHARICQLLNKTNQKPLALFFNKQEKNIIKLIMEFPSLIIDIANSHKVHLLCQYLINLSKMFNSYYTNNRIIGNKNESSMLAIAKIVQIALHNGLDLLAIKVLDKM